MLRLRPQILIVILLIIVVILIKDGGSLICGNEISLWKIHCFLWLCLDNRITTWNILVKRGWHGPNICSLCGKAEETVNHLFIVCHFGMLFRKELSLMLNLDWTWEGSDLNLNLRQWINNDPGFLYLSALFCWSIWKMRNIVLFEAYVPKTS